MASSASAISMLQQQAGVCLFRCQCLSSSRRRLSVSLARSRLRIHTHAHLIPFHSSFKPLSWPTSHSCPCVRWRLWFEGQKHRCGKLIVATSDTEDEFQRLEVRVLGGDRYTDVSVRAGRERESRHTYTSVCAECTHTLSLSHTHNRPSVSERTRAACPTYVTSARRGPGRWSPMCSVPRYRHTGKNFLIDIGIFAH